MINRRYIVIINIIAALFIFLFMYTAITKLLRFETFKSVLHSSPLIGQSAGFIAWCIVLVEWLAVLLLLYPPLRFAGFLLSFLLMTGFTVYILIMLFSASRLPCSCGGILQQLSWKQHFYVNILLSVLAFTGLLLERKKHV